MNPGKDIPRENLRPLRRSEYDPLDGVYTHLTPFTEHDRLRPVAFPHIELRVADLLPPA